MPKHMLMTKAHRRVLVRNHEASRQAIEDDRHPPDHVPVLKLFNPTGQGTWLFTEFDPVNETFFGLCDLGTGTPELGSVALVEIAMVRGRFGLGIERDAWFESKKPLSWHIEQADRIGRIEA